MVTVAAELAGAEQEYRDLVDTALVNHHTQALEALVATAQADTLSEEEFNAAFARIRQAELPFGDSFHDVGNMRGPGEEAGARGLAPTLYLFDPNGHLVELRHY